MRCKQNDCHRKAYTSGWCTTHYRRLRSGQDMDAPIRRYVRYVEGANDKPNPVTAKTIRRRRKKPFAAEYALLAELGLGRS